MGRNSPYSVNFTLRDYGKTKCIFGYDLTAGKNAASLGADMRGRAREGNLKAEIHFNKKLPCAGWLLCLSEWHSGVTISKNRNVVYQYYT